MHGMMSVYVVLLLVAGATQLLHVDAKKISFDACKSEGGKLLEIDVTPCKKQPCTFYKGTNVTCTVIFIPNEEIKTALIEIYGIVSGVKVPFTTSDGCKAGMKCPVKSGQETKIRFTLFVSRYYPSLKLVVQLDMKDQTEKMNFCAKFSAQIEAKGLRMGKEHDIDTNV
jgi:Niemann-Pick C2 protein